MSYSQLHSAHYRILSKGLNDSEYYSCLNILRETNPESLKKVYEICARLKLIDRLRHNLTLFLSDEYFDIILGGGVNIDKEFRYQVDRLKTYLSLTCIDVAAGTGYQHFHEWFSSVLKPKEGAWPEYVSNGLDDLSHKDSLDSLAKYLRKWINESLLRNYLKVHGVKNNFIDFIKTDIPSWLEEWLCSSYYIYEGEILNGNQEDFYFMDNKRKIDLISNYFFYLRNKFTHTVEYIDPHEDSHYELILPEEYNRYDRSYSTRTIHENGERDKPVVWTVSTRFNIAESDIVRLILTVQLRYKLIGINNDDATFITSFIDRTRYRYLGYLFLKELQSNLDVINLWCVNFLDVSTYKQRSYKLDLIDRKYAEKFIELHKKLYPKKGVSLVDLDTYLTGLWRKMTKLNMGRLLSRMAEKPTTCSNRRSSHAHSYCTQFTKVMHVFRPVEHPSIQAAASAHPQSGRCAPGLRRREDFGCPPAAIHRSARRFQHGRLSAHQPLESRRHTDRIAHQPGELGCGSSRRSGLA